MRSITVEEMKQAFPQVHFSEPMNIKAHAPTTFSIGQDVAFSPFVSLIALDKVSIGKSCQFGPGVVVADHDHELSSPDLIRQPGVPRPVTIGSNCWIGANAVILKGVTLGDNVVVGAGSVVNRSFSGNFIIAGNPAQPLREREYEK